MWNWAKVQDEVSLTWRLERVRQMQELAYGVDNRFLPLSTVTLCNTPQAPAPSYEAQSRAPVVFLTPPE